MKTLSVNGNTSGLTLIEVLVVIAVLAVLAAFLLPGLSQVHSGNQRATCFNNQKEICIGFILWQGDNDNQFPWQRSTATNGTHEFIANGHAASQIQALSAYIKSFPVYLCPADKVKVAATDYDHFADTNTSFFVNVELTNNTQFLILTGDRQLVANGIPVDPGLFYYKDTTDMSWAQGLHAKDKFSGGVLGFADCHVEVVSRSHLNTVFRRQGLASDRLEVP